jgi:hypothetical protein
MKKSATKTPDFLLGAKGDYSETNKKIKQLMCHSLR